MRIVHIITRFIRGGADENTLLTCNGQARLGHEVHLIAGEYHPEMVARLDPNVVWHHLPSLLREPSIKDAICLGQLVRLLRKLTPDIVHTHESKAGILGRVAARFSRTPLIVHGVHILPFLNVSRPVAAAYLAMEKFTAKFTDAFISVSDTLLELCIENKIGDASIHFTVPSGMSIDDYRNAQPILRDELIPGSLITEATAIGLIAGHLERRKRVGELIAALATRIDDGDWILLIAGEGPERDHLAEQIAKLGLKERVFLLGFRTDLPQLLATADFYVHAAANEGLPRVVVQAVLAGKPVVAPALPGIDLVVTQGANGLLTDLQSTDALADAFVRLANDAEMRTSFAAGSRAKDLSAWEAGEMVARIEIAYKTTALRKGFHPAEDDAPLVRGNAVGTLA